ncbi:MarR family winged helix-turn-helix transcriptional regulator [Kerstersia gyiorum]|uniref:MarR family winged helix-turn-helix transcriptional regulator n=1 Tax=Kerstersia gyiorum TaxID=206506 RepID=UPI00209E7E07|nr:MarR family transcriptional regulator [Kerstersia gyiorum]MCP1634566.1 DNA-binding MarR family transcriptional regulator [Kerstersia gyiorum]MCP1637981.1 DNA-binding MarR family transcriptional regulator [Kerstersia gyiorum]MCP1672338.1 DNA-binding MarR family transcriptional regulator [Kerstersia gyiorum]MCP1680419.1 DNA-binding MarR family transcriptional regulator [Kerstersia gyiorum]MCP1683705.1 DNA-binding MarR family transcriptional regulator [Kerstersia gyiorum]
MDDTNTRRPADSVDAILAQWRRERPELDAWPMGPIGRIKRCAALLEPPLEAALAEFGLVLWEFDMLATLLRAGHPYRLSPTELFSSLMVTSGTMTHRLKRLEARGFIERLPNAEDARSMLVQLTPPGVALINRAVDVFVEHERRILSVLPEEVLVDLDENLARLLLALEGGQGEAGPGMA